MIRVYTFPEREGVITFTPQEIRELLDQVYDEGFQDGKNSKSNNTITSPSYPYIPTTTPITTPNITWENDPYKITCSSKCKDNNNYVYTTAHNEGDSKYGR